jgi:hypothetical protein
LFGSNTFEHEKEGGEAGKITVGCASTDAPSASSAPAFWLFVLWVACHHLGVHKSPHHPELTGESRTLNKDGEVPHAQSDGVSVLQGLPTQSRGAGDGHSLETVFLVRA